MNIKLQTIFKPQRLLAAAISVFILLIPFIFATKNVEATTGINRAINFQGKLINKADGTNITNNTYTFVFKFYDSSSGGTQLPSGSPWSESQSLTVTDGIFRATLGDITPIPPTLNFNDNSVYLDVTFNSENFGSRVRMTAAPYAINAEKVGGLSVTATTGTLTIPNAKTISFADAFTTSGANPLTLTTTGTTNVTLPTSGLLFGDAASHNFLDAATGTAYAINGSDATSGTNAGGSLTIRAGNASSSGTGGDLILAGGTTSGGTAGNLTLQTAGSTRWTISNAGVLTSTGAQTITTTTGALTLGADTIVGSGKSLRLTGGAGNPTATSGIIWYDTTANKFKIVENSTVKTLCNTTDAGCGAGGSTLWSTIGNPSGNLALTMGANTSTFTYNGTTGAGIDLFNLTDTSSNTGTGYLLNVTTASSSSLKPFHVSAAGTEALTVLANGNVGVGTTAPGGKVQIVNSSGGYTAANYLQIVGSTVDNSNYPGISFKGGTLATTYPIIALNNGGYGFYLQAGSSAGAPNAANLTFDTTQGTLFGFGATTYMKLTTAGNLGIGTTGPDRVLDVLAAASPQVRLTQADGTVYSDFQVDSSGNLTIDGTGTKLVIADDLQVTGNDILDSGAASRLTLGATTTLTNTALNLTGTATLTSSVAMVWNIANSSTTSLNIESGLLDLDTTNSRVGIGTTAPGYTLDVNGQIAGTQGTNAAPSFTDRANGNTGINFRGNAVSIDATIGGTAYFALNGNGFQMKSGTAFAFSSGDPTLVGPDVAFSRGAANKMYVGTGSPGDYTGTLISGTVGIGTTAPTEKLQVEGGNVLIGAQADATAGSYTLTNSAAGTFGGQSGLNGAFSSAIYQGKLYVSVKETDLAAIYRFDGGTTWTKVSDTTSGKIVSGDSAADADAVILTIYNGLLWAGSQTSSGSSTGSVYSYDGSTWTLRNSARGTFGAETARDGVGDMHVWNGRLYVTTQEVNASGLYRYDGNTTWTRLNATVGKGLAETTADIDDGLLISYNGALWWGAKTAASTGRIYAYNANTFILINTTTGTFASGTTGVDDVTSLAVYNGQLFVGTGETNLANIYVYKGGIPPTASTNGFIKTTATSGRLDSTNDATDIDAVPTMRVYNGRLYAGSSTSAGGNLGAVYEYTGVSPTSTNGWTLIGARGTFSSQTNVDQVDTIIQVDNTMYIGTEDSAGNNGSIYSWTKTSQNSYALKFDSGSSNYGSIEFVGNQSAQDNANHTGTFIFSSPISSTTGAFDYAEDYPTNDTSLVPGEIVAVDKENVEFIKRADVGDSYIGVISEKPGFRLSLTNEQKKGYLYLPVALVGRVPVKVSTENGAIQAGDYLTGSSNPGVAMKATKSGSVIGQAMESYSAENVGKIIVFVQTSQITGSVLAAYPGLEIDQESSLSNYDGDANGIRILKTIMKEQATTDGKKRTSELFTDRVVATKEIIAPHIIADLITARKIKADSIEGLEIYTNKLSGLGDNLASLEAKMSDFKNSSLEVKSVSQGDVQKASEQLTLSGLDVEGNATISASLHVWGSGIFDGILNVLDSITTPNLIVGKWADFVGSVIFRSDVNFFGRATFNKDTAGYAVIKKDAKTVSIVFEKEYEAAPVVNASMTLNATIKDDGTIEDSSQKEQQVFDQSYSYYITRKSIRGFTIILNKPASDDISFSWIAFAVRDGMTSEGVSASSPVLTPLPSASPIPTTVPNDPIATSSAIQ